MTATDNPGMPTPTSDSATAVLAGYPVSASCFDELMAVDGRPRAELGAGLAHMLSQSAEACARVQALAEKALLNQGVTFSVYRDARASEKIFPYCNIPRVLSAADWQRLDRGLVQRLTALNLFLDDLYGEQRTLAQEVVPRELVLGASGYIPTLRGVRPPGGVRVHIAGIDLVRDPSGTFRVLEDNLRTPSGVSYVLENRAISRRIHPEALALAQVHGVDDYPTRLIETLRAVSPVAAEDTTVVVLTPGPFNSAYFEHSFLARTMGVELVTGSDLFVEGDRVFMRTTRGPRSVHVIYRRVDDAFLDPETFRPDSLLGVPGLMRAYRRGNVTLVNAPGNGVADDKAIYPFIPDVIRFFLAEEPILEQVPTYVCLRPADRDYVLANLAHLVVKAVDEAGGQGMLIGPQASASERARFAELIAAMPRRYIAQPLIELSTCPTWVPDQRKVAPRRVDLRPYVLTHPGGSWVLPGGLTRVALVEGSYVVNSSQGGGAKDTWVLKS